MTPTQPPPPQEDLPVEAVPVEGIPLVRAAPADHEAAPQGEESRIWSLDLPTALQIVIAALAVLTAALR